MPPARSSNRRATPQAQPASSAPARRHARSESREEANPQAATQASNRRTRATRQGSVDSTNSVDNRGGRATRTTRRGAKNAVATDLDTVEENPTSTATEAPASRRRGARKTGQNATTDLAEKMQALEDPQAQAIEIPGQHYTSPGRVSNISGTTAYSAEAAAEIDIQDILNDLSTLYTKADDILDILNPEDASVEALERLLGELGTPSSRINKILTRREREFKASTKIFSTHGYIRCSTILRALFSNNYANLQPGDGRPDNILYKANLATLALQIVRAASEIDDQEVFTTLREVDQSFPTPFISSFGADGINTVGKSALIEQTLKMNVEIRTQLVIAYLYGLEGEHEVNPHRVIADVFLSADSLYEAASFDDIFTNGEVRKVNIPGLDEQEISARFEELVFPRIGRLRGFFKDAEENEEAYALEKLIEKHPWAKFLEDTLTWVALRDAELEQVIKGDSGANKIVEHLTKQIGASSGTRPKPATSGKVAAGRGSHTVRTDATDSGDTTLRESDINDLNALRDLQRKVGAQQQQDDWQPDNQDEEGEADNAQQAKDQLASSAPLRQIMHEHTKQNKENLRRTQQANPTISPKRYFVDKQPTATRVQWESQGESSVSQAGPAARQRASQGQSKRTREVDNEPEDPSEDEGFAPAKHPQRTISPAKRPRFSEAQISPVGRADQTQRTSRPGRVNQVAQPARPTVAQQQPSSTAADLAAWSTQHSLVNSQAKSHVRASQARKTQIRRPWTSEEVDAFVNYIGELGTAYSTILSRDADEQNILQNRDQVNLKDKAMNMKMDYLKVKQSMPPNFEMIPVRSKHIQYLLDNGIFESEVEIKAWR